MLIKTSLFEKFNVENLDELILVLKSPVTGYPQGIAYKMLYNTIKKQDHLSVLEITELVKKIRIAFNIEVVSPFDRNMEILDSDYKEMIDIPEYKGLKVNMGLGRSILGRRFLTAIYVIDGKTFALIESTSARIGVKANGAKYRGTIMYLVDANYLLKLI